MKWECDAPESRWIRSSLLWAVRPCAPAVIILKICILSVLYTNQIKLVLSSLPASVNAQSAFLFLTSARFSKTVPYVPSVAKSRSWAS
jgi:hypothetical protein